MPALKKFFGLFISLLFSLALSSKTEDQVDLEDQIFELSAQVATLESEMESVTRLATQSRANAFNPAISLVGDFIGQFGVGLADSKGGHHHGHDDEHGDKDHKTEFEDGFRARELEIEFSGAIDPFADGLIAIAFEPHGFHHVDIHIEEAYARLKKWPGLGFAPLGLITKIGKFKTSLGRINRVHLHNTPQITYPMAMQQFLGEEGHAASGLSLNLSFNPTSTGALNLFAEALFNSKLPMQKEGAEQVPTVVAHAWWHQELSSTSFLDIGTSALVGRKGKTNSGTFWLFGGDIHYSYIPHGYGLDPLFLFGSEFFTANANDGAGRWPMGSFTWAQVRLIDTTFFGLRYDLAPKESNVQKFQHAIGAYFTHYTTEFLRFRLGYEHVMPKTPSFNGDHRFMLSMMFVLGSHPIEPYFVNR